ncbi:putative HVA22-like protein g [Zingiber officinale]|uniref:putative HVA22-like protein g n=1 Tax=Zingiber officinale TaxID=94328 RepID=UPI001C4B1C6D|nr:putative HVA22-like protein g [Zingiber officinale]XP_042399784.1 putative HVA22-like protein g [Zingiber officinale]
MIGSFISRVLILALGHVYPAYKCYKTVELNKPEIEQLRFWCQYWILVAFLSVLGAFADVFFSWLPLYYEAKLGIYLFLWYPQTNGATIVYEKYVGPYIAEHEHEIDLTLLEFRARASDSALIAQQLLASFLKASLSGMVKYALLMMPAQKLDAFQFQQLQQPGQPQEPLTPSVMLPAHQPAASQPPQSEARALFDPMENSEPQEQPIKEGISLHPSPAQSQERVPETQFANCSSTHTN